MKRDGRRPDPREIYALTFDCYGTLIDWQRGVRAACAQMRSLVGGDLARLVRDREFVERDLQRGDYKPYAEVLARSIVLAAREQDREVSDDEARRFAASMRSWPPFGESAPALKRLAARYQLAILSNVETEVLKASMRALEAPFEDWITAEMVSAYKPARAHFDAAIERLGLPKERIIHVACSLHHDVRPASQLGWFTAWVNRESETPPDDLAPSWTVPDLSTLASELGC
jgi:2-haloalkanoic acid dehalogenase type II